MRAVLSPVPRFLSSVLVILLAVAACADETSGAADDGPRLVATTTILGDIVRQLVEGRAVVEVIMPRGVDPHDFSPSARQAESMETADLLVVNGAGFEAGMTKALDAATKSGAPVFSFADHVRLRRASADHPDEAGDHHQAGGDADGGDHQERVGERGEDHADDPHFWLDPAGMVDAVNLVARRISEIEGIEGIAVLSRAASYLSELGAVDTEVERRLSGIPPERRVLVTNHEVLGYFADRYRFEVVGTIIPSVTTGAEPSAADIDKLAELMRTKGVRAVFAETTDATALARALAGSAGADVKVVQLHTESLGEDGTGADSYTGMLRANAELIAEALS